jgi:hypothetical protein
MKGQWPLMYPESGAPAEFKAAVLMWVALAICSFCEDTYISGDQSYDVYGFCPTCIRERGMQPAIPL